MNDTNNDIYRKLQEHMNSMPVGFPATESGVEIRILKHLFTPEQAKIALQLKFQPISLKKIYRRFRKSGITLEGLEKKLDEMFFKGLINRGISNLGDIEEKYYANAALAIGIYEGTFFASGASLEFMVRLPSRHQRRLKSNCM